MLALGNDMNRNRKALFRLYDYFGISTQGELAKKLGCCPSRVSQLYTTKAKIPDSCLLHLLREYGLNPEWVLNGDPHPIKLKPDV